ncbi:TPA: hypothetical protein IDY64_004756 [Escherichia coli]|nr:hypothetical protein [Escherichia coli]EFI8192949.1 hypothetical protein [Escherichia coli]HAM8918994.1 hypothetical protein [Escherichia coli]HAM9519855.1 hypothetical protein [Escherichia coli]HAN1810507.1 hypothetical protein [Escherichia coli]
MSQGISNLCFFSVVQVTDTDARVFFYDFLRLFQNIQLHLLAAYFLIQSGDFLPQCIAFCLQGRFVMFTHSLVSTVADNFIFPFINTARLTPIRLAISLADICRVQSAMTA